MTAINVLLGQALLTKVLLAASGLAEFYKYFDQVKISTSLKGRYSAQWQGKLLVTKLVFPTCQAGHSMFDAMAKISDLRAGS